MNLSLSASAEDFRRRLRDWLDARLSDDTWTAPVGPDGEARLMELRKRWGRLLHEEGWAAPEWPTAFGGLGLGFEEAVVYVEEMARSGAPQPFNSNAINILGPTLMHHGTEEQRERLLPPMIAHESAWCQAFSEPGAGSDLAGIVTRAEPSADGSVLRLTGHKIWSSRAQYADHCYALVRTDPASTRQQGLSLVVLRLDQPGVEVRPIDTIAGTSDFCEIFLDGAVVPTADVIGPVGEGWKVAMYALGRERGPRQAERTMTMADDLDRLVAALTRDGEPLEGTTLADVVDLHVRAAEVRAVVRRILAQLADDAPLGILPSVLKLDWSRTHQDILALRSRLLPEETLLGREVENAVQERLLYTRGYSLQSGTTEIQRNIVAKSLGMPSSRRGG